MYRKNGTEILWTDSLILSDPQSVKSSERAGWESDKLTKYCKKKMFKVFAGLLSGLDLPILFTSLLLPHKDVLVPTKEREYAY